jgi:hypothetical protein
MFSAPDSHYVFAVVSFQKTTKKNYGKGQREILKSMVKAGNPH